MTLTRTPTLNKHQQPFLPLARVFAAMVPTLVAACWLCVAGNARGQSSASGEVSPGWPAMERLAEAVADREHRDDALLTVAAVAQLQASLRARPADDPAAAARQLLSDRDWLEGLARRFGRPEPRSPVLDPAAWRVQLKLDQYQLVPSFISSPLGPGLEITLERVFDRDDAALAAAVLPELLWYLETNATSVWLSFGQQLAAVPALHDELAGQANHLWAAWPDAPAEDNAFDAQVLLDEASQSLTVLAAQTANVGPPDPDRLRSLQSRLLRAMPTLEFADRAWAGSLLHMTSLIDGLHEQRLFRFTEGLLAIMAQLEQYTNVYADEVRHFSGWINQILPVISRVYARDFAAVDPRLNSAIAAAYDVSGSLARPAAEVDGAALRLELGDAVAGLALLVPDSGYYFDLPVRDPVAGGVDACAGIVAVRDSDGSPAMNRELFDDCQQTLVDLADREAREPQLAGDPGGPFGEAQLQRELGLTAGQRINYGVGYLHDRFATGCGPPARPLPNPLEWAYLATFMAWLAEQSPVFFQAPENEARLSRMRDIGTELMQALAEQVDCIAGAGASINDPVARVTAGYRESLTELGRALQDAEQEFRTRFLAPGADVNLAGDARQATNYRPDDLVIGPCSPTNVCEMNGQLSSTRALVGLFPDTWLLADQVGVGEVEICYDEMGWVNRRSAPVREGDRNVANYFGRLSFVLKGRFTGLDGTRDLFAFRFVSPGEHHYLFAAASDEVLDDACPAEWVGNRIVTELPPGRPGIVPNRLTYLSAPRTVPSRLLSANWDQGEEWRDWFVTGLGVQPLTLPSPQDPAPALGQRLQQLHRREQAAVYGSLLERPGAGEQPLTPIHTQVESLETAKDLVRMQMMLFYPHVMSQSDSLRSAVAGERGLLDTEVLNRFRGENRPVDSVVDIGFRRLDAFEARWRELPEAVRRNGSIADSVAHAMVRLDVIHQQYFAPTVSAPARSEQQHSQEGGGQ